MSERNEQDLAFNRLTDFLVEDILNMPDEEILTECQELWGDPNRNAEAIRALIEQRVCSSGEQHRHAQMNSTPMSVRKLIDFQEERTRRQDNTREKGTHYDDENENGLLSVKCCQKG